MKDEGTDIKRLVEAFPSFLPQDVSSQYSIRLSESHTTTIMAEKLGSNVMTLTELHARDDAVAQTSRPTSHSATPVQLAPPVSRMVNSSVNIF